MKTYEGLITEVLPNQIIVFGSNPLGINGNPLRGTGGAALVAHRIAGVKQGEIMDNTISRSGKAWGLTTVSKPVSKRSKTIKQIFCGIVILYTYALSRPEIDFLIMYQGSNGNNLNGYSNKELSEMFASTAYIPENIVFEKEFCKLVEEARKVKYI